MRVLRFVMLFSLAVWIGALVFFPVVAQSAFAELPSSYLAGTVVRSSLIKLHWIGLLTGFLFLSASLINNHVVFGRPRISSLNHFAVLLMLALTAISQFSIIPKMDALRVSAGEIASLPTGDPIRVQFDSLHQWATRLESAVLLLGVVALYSTSKRLLDQRA
jgi:hypothetical protein